MKPAFALALAVCLAGTQSGAVAPVLGANSSSDQECLTANARGTDVRAAAAKVEQIKAAIAQSQAAKAKAIRVGDQEALAIAEQAIQLGEASLKAAQQRLEDARSVQRSGAALRRCQIAGIQNALRQLNRAMSLDASQRQEWEEASAQASQDAWLMGGSLALEGMGHAVDSAIKSTDREIKEAVRLHRKVKPLRNRLARLEQLRAIVKKTKTGYDDVASAKTSSQSSVRDGALELIWSRGEDLGLVPPVAHAGKSAVDASYLVAVQAASVLRLNQINGNQERYLEALKVLKARLEALVKTSKEA